MPAADLIHDSVKNALIVERHHVGLVVINVPHQEVVQWIEPRITEESSDKS